MHKICVIGLGYVGKPLAQLFATKYPTVGFDTDKSKIEKISREKPQYLCTFYETEIKDCDIYIVAVPTPVDQNYTPNLQPLISATKIVAGCLKKNDTVIYESTVYPGVTEEECVPVLEKISGMKLNKEFFVGYSPERINPGDDKHTVENIKKVTSGSTHETAEMVDELYNSVLKNGTYKAPSIKVAEAAKIIENCQRDINIAFINELARIFNAMGIDTHEVLEAAATKWNFLKFEPGLVGGHCISVDPYYLINKAKVYGVYPRIMMNARRLNDGMGEYVANQTIKCMNKKGIVVKDSTILILGFTFKENCPDIRNSKVADIYHTLTEYTHNIEIVDPLADKQLVMNDFGIQITNEIPVNKKYDAIILAVAHNDFKSIDITTLKNSNAVVYDVKGFFDRKMVDGRL